MIAIIETGNYFCIISWVRQKGFGVRIDGLCGSTHGIGNGVFQVLKENIDTGFISPVSYKKLTCCPGCKAIYR